MPRMPVKFGRKMVRRNSCIPTQQALMVLGFCTKSPICCLIFGEKYNLGPNFDGSLDSEGDGFGSLSVNVGGSQAKTVIFKGNIEKYKFHKLIR